MVSTLIIDDTSRSISSTTIRQVIYNLDQFNKYAKQFYSDVCSTISNEINNGGLNLDGISIDGSNPAYFAAKRITTELTDVMDNTQHVLQDFFDKLKSEQRAEVWKAASNINGIDSDKYKYCGDKYFSFERQRVAQIGKYQYSTTFVFNSDLVEKSRINIDDLYNTYYSYLPGIFQNIYNGLYEKTHEINYNNTQINTFNYIFNSDAQLQNVSNIIDRFCKVIELIGNLVSNLSTSINNYNNSQELDYNTMFYDKHEVDLEDMRNNSYKNVISMINGVTVTGVKSIFKIPDNYDDSHDLSVLLNLSDGNSKLSTDEIVDQVMNGQWGNGQERIDRLTAAGYDYNEIQRIINERYDGGSTYITPSNQDTGAQTTAESTSPIVEDAITNPDNEPETQPTVPPEKQPDVSHREDPDSGQLPDNKPTTGDSTLPSEDNGNKPSDDNGTTSDGGSGDSTKPITNGGTGNKTNSSSNVSHGGGSTNKTSSSSTTESSSSSGSDSSKNISIPVKKPSSTTTGTKPTETIVDSTTTKSGNSNVIPTVLGIGALGAAGVAGARYVKNKKDKELYEDDNDSESTSDEYSESNDKYSEPTKYKAGSIDRLSLDDDNQKFDDDISSNNSLKKSSGKINDLVLDEVSNIKIKDEFGNDSNDENTLNFE